MEGSKRSSLGARKKVKRKSRRLVRSIVTFLKSDAYLFAPLFPSSPPPPPQIQTHPPSNFESSNSEDLSMAAGFEALGIERVNKKTKRRTSEKVKEYLKSDYHMYGPMISLPNLGSSLKGKLQITNLVTMEVSTSTTKTMRDDDKNSYRNLRSDIAEKTLHNGRINSPKRAVVIVEGQRSRETDVSPAFASPPVTCLVEKCLKRERLVKPDQRRVTIERR
ncbi:unnamed protein product [Thlaspi arvense]|uniref:Uncharacterized protein n=1 Tax=Thlaspi arvense TaxID=13288 RepID=A0AAU9SM30_THLAR|nr:unnamed protein product [Thlaspi arvense]